MWEFIIHLVKTEHMTYCKSSDNIREKYVATQKQHRVDWVKPRPMSFCSQCLLFGLGRDYHPIYFFSSKLKNCQIELGEHIVALKRYCCLTAAMV